MNKHTHGTRVESELLTVREAAKILRVDDTTLRRWLHTGLMEAVQLPRAGSRQSWRIKRSTIEALLQTTAAPRRVE